MAVLEHILQLCCLRRYQLNTSLHCKGDVEATRPQGQAATVPLYALVQLLGWDTCCY